MTINDYFYPAIRRFALLNEGDCFVTADMPCMKIKTNEEGIHPVNAVMLSDGLAIHIPEDNLVFLAEVSAVIQLKKDERTPIISTELEQKIVDSWNRGELATDIYTDTDEIKGAFERWKNSLS